MELSKISKDIIENHMVRYTCKQKDDFIELLQSRLKHDNNIVIQEEKYKGCFCKNIIIGNIDTAQIILTAHYDTPKKTILGFPHICFANLKMRVLWNIINIVFFIVIMLGVASVSLLVGAYISPIITLVLYFCISRLILTLKPINKNNYNDNTSGVIALIETILSLGINEREKVAFIFFDNEEKGLRGSKAFHKGKKEKLNHKIIINFDCIGVGNYFVFATQKTPNFVVDRLKSNYTSCENNIVIFTDRIKFNSDNKSFDGGVGVMSFKKKWVLFLNHIHSRKDTVLNKDNIKFIVSSNKKLIKSLDD